MEHLSTSKMFRIYLQHELTSLSWAILMFQNRIATLVLDGQSTMVFIVLKAMSSKEGFISFGHGCT